MCNPCEMMMAQAEVSQAPYERGLEEYPPEWQADLKRLSAIVYDLADRYKDQVRIRIWDPRSFQGLIRSIRHGVRRYPTFIVNGRQKFSGWDTEKMEKNLQSSHSDI